MAHFEIFHNCKLSKHTQTLNMQLKTIRKYVKNQNYYFIFVIDLRLHKNYLIFLLYRDKFPLPIDGRHLVLIDRFLLNVSFSSLFSANCDLALIWGLIFALKEDVLESLSKMTDQRISWDIFFVISGERAMKRVLVLRGKINYFCIGARSCISMFWSYLW